MIRIAVLLIPLIPAIGFAGGSPASGKLVIYTSTLITQLNMMTDMFNDQYPSIIVDVFSVKTPI